jgi:hypothetical protein
VDQRVSAPASAAIPGLTATDEIFHTYNLTIDQMPLRRRDHPGMHGGIISEWPDDTLGIRRAGQDVATSISTSHFFARRPDSRSLFAFHSCARFSA